MLRLGNHAFGSCVRGFPRDADSGRDTNHECPSARPPATACTPGGPDRTSTKLHEFIGPGAVDATKTHKSIGSGAMDVTKPHDLGGLPTSAAQTPLTHRVSIGVYPTDAGIGKSSSPKSPVPAPSGSGLCFWDWGLYGCVHPSLFGWTPDRHGHCWASTPWMRKLSRPGGQISRPQVGKSRLRGANSPPHHLGHEESRPTALWDAFGIGFGPERSLCSSRGPSRCPGASRFCVALKRAMRHG